MMVLRRMVLRRRALLLLAAVPILIALAWATTALAAPAAAPPTPHALEGRSECISCHGPGTTLAVPADHAGRANATCVACHAAPQTSDPVEITPPSSSGQTSPASTNAAPTNTTPATSTLADTVNKGATCLTCHANPDLKVKFADGSELSAHVDEATLAASTHGAVGPGCADCHTDINGYPHPQVEAKSAREYSESLKSALPTTCSRCHQGASKSFAAAWTGHSAPSAQDAPLVYYVNLAYQVIIPVTVLSLLAFIGLDAFRRVRNRTQPRKR